MSTTVIVSGGFDPIHPGHIRLFKAAKELGDYLHVIINNDNWLLKKKGYVFQPQNERREIIESLKPVFRTSITDHCLITNDMTVCSELSHLRRFYPEFDLIFANGGDRLPENTPEVAHCKELGIKLAFNVGGKKITSSSEIVGKIFGKLGPTAIASAGKVIDLS